MAAVLKGIRTFGGKALQLIGLTTVGTAVVNAESKTADYLTMFAVALIAIIFIGGRR